MTTLLNLALLLLSPPAEAGTTEIFGGRATLRASSVLKSDDHAYAPEKLFDGDLKTAWSEGVDGVGDGQWVEIELAEPTELIGIAFVPGYHKSAERFEQNSAPRKIHLELDGKALPTGIIGYQLKMDYEADGGRSPRDMGCYHTAEAFQSPWRLVMFPETRKAKKVRLVIDSGLHGTKWADTLISELVLIGEKGPHRTLPAPVYRAADVVGELRDGKSPNSVFASKVTVSEAQAGRAERRIMASWQGKPGKDLVVSEVANAEMGGALKTWWAGNKAGLYDVPVAVSGRDVLGGRTETHGDGEWLELYPVVQLDGSEKVTALTEWSYYDGSPGCHHVLPKGP